MSFSKMVEILKKKEKNKIVFIECGAFYLAMGEDAIFLHEKFEFKCTCFLENVCKIGIPINSLEKYIRKLDDMHYAYVVYDFDKEESKLRIKYISKGKYHNIEEKSINCLTCKGTSKYKEDKYLEAVTKLLEENGYAVKG